MLKIIIINSNYKYIQFHYNNLENRQILTDTLHIFRLFPPWNLKYVYRVSLIDRVQIRIILYFLSKNKYYKTSCISFQARKSNISRFLSRYNKKKQKIEPAFSQIKIHSFLLAGASVILDRPHHLARRTCRRTRRARLPVDKTAFSIESTTRVQTSRHVPVFGAR